MASLREIKTRIGSVKSTQKITSAMQMISSVKLRKAERQIVSFYPYEQKLKEILNTFLSSEEEFKSVCSEQREIKRVAIVAFASNSSLCGSYNSNVIRKLRHRVEEYSSLGKENILVFPLGKKVAQAVKGMGLEAQGCFEQLIDNPNYAEIQNLANKLIEMYLNKEIDAVELIYHHFKSRGSQILLHENFLPANFDSYLEENEAENLKNSLYLIEPGREEIIEELIPKTIRLRLYTVLLDAAASEHAARMIAMQVATDNADELLDDLTLQYNKSRQQAITNELLDIIGGSFGQE